MRDDEFEWDDAKAATNERDHGISFGAARAASKDPFGIARIDCGQSESEERFALLGIADDRLLFVAYTLRGARVRIISARRLNRWRDGAATMKTEKFDWSRADAMTDAQVHEAAMKDPDARPMTDARFHIPLGTLRDWEQGTAVPDETARAYLHAIAGDPAAVEKALRVGPRPQ